MKTVKILSMTLLMSIFCVGMAFAQQPTPKKAPKAPKVAAEQKATKRIEMMKKTLNLTPDQVTKLQALFTKEGQNHALKATPEEKKAKMEACNAQIKTILTPEQFQKYEGMHKKAAEKKAARAEKKAARVDKKAPK